MYFPPYYVPDNKLFEVKLLLKSKKKCLLCQKDNDKDHLTFYVPILAVCSSLTCLVWECSPCSLNCYSLILLIDRLIKSLSSAITGKYLLNINSYLEGPE